MLFKKLRKLLKINEAQDYYYVVNADTKTVVECSDLNQARVLSAALNNLPIYDHFPHQEYGYEDSYLFIIEWAVYSDDGIRVRIESDAEGFIRVVE